MRLAFGVPSFEPRRSRRLGRGEGFSSSSSSGRFIAVPAGAMPRRSARDGMVVGMGLTAGEGWDIAGGEVEFG